MILFLSGDILHYTPQDDQPVQIMLVGSDGIVGTNQPLTVLLCNCFGGGCNFNTLLSGGNKFAVSNRNNRLLFPSSLDHSMFGKISYL